MRAIVKNKLLVKFDKAINDARDCDNEILEFRLESETENRMLRKWMEISTGYNEADTYDYEGIPVREYEGEVR